MPVTTYAELIALDSDEEIVEGMAMSLAMSYLTGISGPELSWRAEGDWVFFVRGELITYSRSHLIKWFRRAQVYALNGCGDFLEALQETATDDDRGIG